MPPMSKITEMCTSIAHCGLEGLPDPAVAAMEARLVLKSTRAACVCLTRVVQFILSCFPGTSGKQSMHHLKDASMKQLGCVKLFML